MCIFPINVIEVFQMNKFISSISSSVTSFLKEEEGAQVVEYALIIALVSIALAVALAGTSTTGLRAAFTTLVTRVTTCFGATGCSAT
jgi:pilus assembly protein Flp/PilA